MEGEALLDEYIALKEGKAKMKERYMNLLSDRDHLLTMDEMYHYVVKKEEEEVERLTNKLEITIDLLKSTQISLRELKLQICQLQNDLKMSHLSCFMEENVLGIVEGPHVEDNHEGGADWQVFVKSPNEDYFGQTLVGMQNGIEEDIAMGKIARDIPFESASSGICLSKD